MKLSQAVEIAAEEVEKQAQFRRDHAASALDERKASAAERHMLTAFVLGSLGVALKMTADRIADEEDKDHAE